MSASPRPYIIARTTFLTCTAAIVSAIALSANAQSELSKPEFHHLHLNSMNPDTASHFYEQMFPSAKTTTFAGQPAVLSETNVLILFNKVDAPPATQPATAFWHFGWHVTDVHESIKRYQELGATILPLYKEESGGTVATNADSWPNPNGGIGSTRRDIAQAKATSLEPTYGAGFSYLRGPDDAVIEAQGNMPSERFNHLHFWMAQPLCTQLWYQQHLNAASINRRGSAQVELTWDNCETERGADKTWPALSVHGMHREPSMNRLRYSDVSFYGYVTQSDEPLVSTRGHVMDHYALSVQDLDSWVTKLRSEGVRFLEQEYLVGEYRAIMIEGPNLEAIELLEIAP